MSDSNSNDSSRTTGRRDSKASQKPKTTGTGQGARASARAKSPSDVGRALRSVYDSTLGERVPDDFLTLLGKLS